MNHLDHVADFARPAILDLHKILFSHVRLLIVVDPEISLSPDADAFGIERVIRLMRETSVGCIDFHVDVARRNNSAFSVVAAPTGANPKYQGFRFNSTLPDGSRVIDKYDEVWCFGFKPHGGFIHPTNDADITVPGALPATDAELAVLTTWMNNKGGLFATGDHDFVGASMCSRIPRIGTMRAWTNVQNVPPVDGPLRIDTNRPANPAELAGMEVIEFERQSDIVPQPISWVPWMSFHVFPGRIHQRPHPVLCHPTLGPINVMPDHPHEGACFDHVAQPDISLDPITLTNTYNFGGGVAGDEYPTVGGVQPLPMVIAHGQTLSDPPLMQEKGDTAAKRFAMISVYDGHRIGLGRVATDSTWHHWMNINITELEAAGGNNWEKIKRYYLNLGVWLAPPRIRRHCFFIHVLESFYSYPGIEEFHPKVALLDQGFTFRHRLIKLFGPCWVTQFIIDWVGEIDSRLGERLIERYLAVPLPKKEFPPRPDPCLTCPPPELFEAAILGGVIRAAGEFIHKDGGGLEASVKRLQDLRPEGLEKQLIAGTSSGLKELQTLYSNSLKLSKQMLG